VPSAANTGRHSGRGVPPIAAICTLHTPSHRSSPAPKPNLSLSDTHSMRRKDATATQAQRKRFRNGPIHTGIGRVVRIVAFDPDVALRNLQPLKRPMRTDHITFNSQNTLADTAVLELWGRHRVVQLDDLVAPHPSHLQHTRIHQCHFTFRVQ
jgi:hypothetical protein